MASCANCWVPGPSNQSTAPQRLARQWTLTYIDQLIVSELLIYAVTVAKERRPNFKAYRIQARRNWESACQRTEGTSGAFSKVQQLRLETCNALQRYKIIAAGLAL